MRNFLTFAALAAATAFAAPAAAQSAPAEAKGLIIQPLTFVNLDALDFGTVIASNVAGSVTIDPSDGARVTSGGVSGAPSAPGGRGLFEGLGASGQVVELSYTVPTQLNHNSIVGQAVAFRNFTLDGAASRTIGLGGTFQVGVGGTIDIAANQTPGLYSAQFEVTADYQ
jgi:hypothetical protein